MGRSLVASHDQDASTHAQSMIMCDLCVLHMDNLVVWIDTSVYCIECSLVCILYALHATGSEQSGNCKDMSGRKRHSYQFHQSSPKCSKDSSRYHVNMPQPLKPTARPVFGVSPVTPQNRIA